MTRRRGLSARLRLTLSYAAFLLLAGALLLAVTWVFALRWLPTTDPEDVPDIYRDMVVITGPSRSELLQGFVPAAATALACLLGVGLLGGWLLAGRMLAPLTRIADAARLAARGSLAHRIRLAGPRDEFRELADVFDTMLHQLESHVAEQQRFAANASHELRTPLAISQALLDVARDDPTRNPRELLDRLRTVNARAIDLTEALLLLSRGDHTDLAREPVDLSLVAEEAAESLLPLAERRGITVDVTGEPTRTLGSQALLLRMVTNLVQNAVVHNLPVDGVVRVHTEQRSDASVLRVENTGPALSAELVPTLAEPFQRGTARARTDEHAGVGLGLAIVRSIVHAHDGSLQLVPRSGGGLRVTVRLPGARRTSSFPSDPSPASPASDPSDPSDPSPAAPGSA